MLATAHELQLELDHEIADEFKLADILHGVVNVNHRIRLVQLPVLILDYGSELREEIVDVVDLLVLVEEALNLYP